MMRETALRHRHIRQSRKRKARRCPECGSFEICPVVHGIPTQAWQKAIEAGKAILSDREEWEGMTKWYCKTCGCDWSGKWRRFKKSGGINATGSKS